MIKSDRSFLESLGKNNSFKIMSFFDKVINIQYISGGLYNEKNDN